MKMKTILFIMATTIITLTSCMESQGDGNGGGGVKEQPKTVCAYAPEMNNMEMLCMTQMPGWKLLAGTQWIGNSFCNSIKGVNENLNATFFYDGNRNYAHSDKAKSAISDANGVYLSLMPAADYLDYVFHSQFPNVKNAKRTILKTKETFPEAEQQQLEEKRMEMYNAVAQMYRQSAGAAYTQVRNQTADRASAEYEWVQDGETIVHFMEVVLLATYTDITGPYAYSSYITWNQYEMLTATYPAKNKAKAKEDVDKMVKSVTPNEQYMATLRNIVQQGMQAVEQQMRRTMSEMAQAEMRHQQKMTKMIQETNDYISKTQRESFANQQASKERISQGWRDAIVGVDRYVGNDGKVVEIPTSMGSSAWQSADGGTIYTSDSYMFKAVDNLYDKDGRVQEFRQMQLLK